MKYSLYYISPAKHPICFHKGKYLNFDEQISDCNATGQSLLQEVSGILLFEQVSQDISLFGSLVVSMLDSMIL